MVEVQALGTLKQDPDIPEWWVSSPIPVPFFGGERLQFVITTELQGNDFSPDVETAISNFLSLDEQYKFSVSEAVYRNYCEYLEAVEEFELPISKPTEIWDYVTPTQIYVSRRSGRDKNIYIKAACECEWEIEHGLQLVFRNGTKLTRVSEQDGHLTHTDAYDLPEEEEPVI